MEIEVSGQGIHNTMNGREWMMLLTLSVLWGGSFFFQEVAVTELPPLTIVLSRVMLAALTLFLFGKIFGVTFYYGRQVWLAFFMMGLLNNVIPFTLIVWGQTHIASGLASILNATTPLFTVLIAHFFTADERADLGKIVGVLFGFLGVIVIVGGGVFHALGDSLFAQLAVLAAACTYGFAGVYGRRFRKMGVSPLATAAGQVTASSVLLLPVVLIVDQPWTLIVPSLEVAVSVLGLAVLSTAAAYLLFFRILSSVGATNLLLVTFLIPISAILLGISVLGEVLEFRHMIGMALIGAGLVVIDGRFLRFVGKT